ncbi:MAG: hypothetical protein ACYCVL_04565, partial [Gemmatimonadaceae bacterium]
DSLSDFNPFAPGERLRIWKRMRRTDRKPPEERMGPARSSLPRSFEPSPAAFVQFDESAG